MKKNSILEVLAILLSIVVLGLTAFIVYDKVLNKEAKNENNNNEVKLNEEEARKIVEEKTKLVFNYVNALMPYCGDRDYNDFIGTDDYQKWDASTSYSNKNELSNYLRTFMSENVMNEYSFEKTYTVEIYKEENNKLYCYHPITGGGSHYNDGKSSYQILDVTDNSIDAVGNIFFDTIDGMMSDITTIRLEKDEKNNWVMVSYASFLDGMQDSLLVETYLDKIVFVNDINNKKKIAVYYNDKETTNAQEIEAIKKEIHEKYKSGTRFNIVINYDNIGYISRIAFNAIS